MQISFDDLIHDYLNLLAKGNKYLEAYEGLGRIKMYQDLFPAANQQEILHQLPLPIEIDYVQTPSYRKDLDKYGMYISFKSKVGDYSAYYWYDFQTNQWISDEKRATYTEDGDYLNSDDLAELVSFLSFTTHPALSSILEKEKNKIQYYLRLSTEPFTSVQVQDKIIFFNFEDDYFCFKSSSSISRHFCKKSPNGNDYSYDNACSYLFDRINLLERLLEHPNVRLKHLFV